MAENSQEEATLPQENESDFAKERHQEMMGDGQAEELFGRSSKAVQQFDDEGAPDTATDARESGLKSQARLQEQRFQKQLAEEEAQEADSGPDWVDKMKADAAMPGPPVAKVAAKLVGKRLRWYLWGASVVTFGLTILVLDFLYIARSKSKWFASFVPKPYTWEVIALIVITCLALGLIIGSFIIMIIPVVFLSGSVWDIVTGIWSLVT